MERNKISSNTNFCVYWKKTKKMFEKTKIPLIEKKIWPYAENKLRNHSHKTSGEMLSCETEWHSKRKKNTENKEEIEETKFKPTLIVRPSCFCKTCYLLLKLKLNKIKNPQLQKKSATRSPEQHYGDASDKNDNSKNSEKLH